MKFLQLFYVLFLLCYNVFDAKAQNYSIKCLYKFEYQVDSTNVDSRKTEDMLLFLGDDISVFKSFGLYMRDSSIKNIQDVTKLPLINRQFPTAFDFQIVKSNSQIHYTNRISREYFTYSEPRSVLNWQISSEVSFLNNFNCQKAIANYGGRTWIAWFTTEVSRSDGPYKFCGLPGLIVKVYDSQGFFSFTLKEIINRPGNVLNTLNNPTKTTREKFISSFEYFQKNRFEVIVQEGSKFTDPATEAMVRKNMEERYKKENLRIELK